MEAGVVTPSKRIPSETDLDEEDIYVAQIFMIGGVPALTLDRQKAVNMVNEKASRTRRQFRKNQKSVNRRLKSLVSISRYIRCKALANQRSRSCLGQQTICSARPCIITLTVWLRDHLWMMIKLQNTLPSGREGYKFK